MNKTTRSNARETIKKHTFCGSYSVSCFNRSRAIDSSNYKTYFIRKNHIVGNPSDELIDLDDDLLNEALKETIELNKKKGIEWKHTYPQPIVVRSKFRPINQPLLIIYPLNPEYANVKDENGNIVPGTTIFTAEDDPFVGFAISFPHTNTNCAVSYKVNMVAEYADIEDNFDNENDNTYGD